MVQLEFRTLEGEFVRLEPFSNHLKPGVQKLLNCDPDTWRILPVNGQGEAFENYWKFAEQQRAAGVRFPFAIWDLGTERIAGTSSFYGNALKMDCVEIGSTFFHPDFRGGYANPESKRLMLGHAFSSGARRAQFSVDVRNLRSQRAMQNLGATKEGVLRQNQQTWTGFWRDTAIFSILASEWDTVRRGIDERLASFSR